MGFFFLAPEFLLSGDLPPHFSTALLCSFKAGYWFGACIQIGLRAFCCALYQHSRAFTLSSNNLSSISLTPTYVGSYHSPIAYIADPLRYHAHPSSGIWTWDLTRRPAAESRHEELDRSANTAGFKQAFKSLTFFVQKFTMEKYSFFATHFLFLFFGKSPKEIHHKILTLFETTDSAHFTSCFLGQCAKYSPQKKPFNHHSIFDIPNQFWDWTKTRI